MSGEQPPPDTTSKLGDNGVDNGADHDVAAAPPECTADPAPPTPASDAAVSVEPPTQATEQPPPPPPSPPPAPTPPPTPLTDSGAMPAPSDAPLQTASDTEPAAPGLMTQQQLADLIPGLTKGPSDDAAVGGIGADIATQPAVEPAPEASEADPSIVAVGPAMAIAETPAAADADEDDAGGSSGKNAVERILAKVGLSEFVPQFAAEEIVDLETLGCFADADLAEIIPDADARTKLLEAVAKANTAAKAKAEAKAKAAAATPQQNWGAKGGYGKGGGKGNWLPPPPDGSPPDWGRGGQDWARGGKGDRGKGDWGRGGDWGKGGDWGRSGDWGKGGSWGKGGQDWSRGGSWGKGGGQDWGKGGGWQQGGDRWQGSGQGYGQDQQQQGGDRWQGSSQGYGQDQQQQQQSGYVQNSQQPRMIGLQDIENFVRNNPQVKVPCVRPICVPSSAARGIVTGSPHPRPRRPPGPPIPCQRGTAFAEGRTHTAHLFTLKRPCPVLSQAPSKAFPL